MCFTEDRSVSVVPTSWLDNDKAYWPPYDVQKKIDKAVRQVEKPNEQWRTYPVKILGVTGSSLVIVKKTMIGSGLTF